MNLDKLVTTDLAALATDAKQRPVGLDATLRVIGVIRDADREEAGARTVLAVGREFAHRVAQASAGGAALVLVGGLLAIVTAVGETHNYGGGFVTGGVLDGWYAWHSVAAWTLGMVTLVALAYFAARAGAAGRFHRAVRDDRTEGLLQCAARSSVWLPIAGATAIAAVLGSLWLTIGDLPVAAAWTAPWGAIVAAGIAIALAIVGAALIARAVARGRRVGLLAHRGVIMFGVLVAVVAMTVALRFDAGPVPVYWQGAIGVEPSTPLRVGVVLAWTLAAFLVSAGLVVRGRVAITPCTVDGVAVLDLCRVYSHRVARAAAGLAAVAFVAAMLAALAFGSPDPHFALWQGVPYVDAIEPGPWYLAHDVVAWAGAMIVATSAVYFAGYTLAARRFERALAGSSDLQAAGRTLVRRVDGLSLALAIAGATTIAVALGSLWFVIGDLPLAEANPGTAPSTASWLRQIVAAIACVVIAAAGIARTGRGVRAALEHVAVIGGAILLGLITLCIGFELDVGPLWNRGAVGIGEPSFALRGILMAAGTFAVFVVVTGLALRRRRRELATGSSPAPSPAPSAER